MPEKNKCETEKRENGEEKAEEKDVWSEDQKKRRYYYDDSHGYEIYDPEKEDDKD